jgi:hypothetical protein
MDIVPSILSPVGRKDRRIIVEEGRVGVGTLPPGAETKNP